MLRPVFSMCAVLGAGHAAGAPDRRRVSARPAPSRRLRPARDGRRNLPGICPVAVGGAGQALQACAGDVDSGCRGGPLPNKMIAYDQTGMEWPCMVYVGNYWRMPSQRRIFCIYSFEFGNALRQDGRWPWRHGLASGSAVWRSGQAVLRHRGRTSPPAWAECRLAPPIFTSIFMGADGTL